VKETPPLPRYVCCHPRPTPLVVQFSDSRWTTAPHLPQPPDQPRLPDQADSAPPAKDDIVGWPDEILIDFANVPNGHRFCGEHSGTGLGHVFGTRKSRRVYFRSLTPVGLQKSNFLTSIIRVPHFQWLGDGLHAATA
jgi:hypothetical protein